MTDVASSVADPIVKARKLIGPYDPELLAMRKIDSILSALQPEAAFRAIKWAAAKHGERTLPGLYAKERSRTGAVVADHPPQPPHPAESF